MRSIKIIIPAAITAITVLQSCSSKDFDHCNESLVVTATADTAVIVGNTLKLSTTGIEFEKVQMYNWYGPNRFSSHEEAPEIYNVTGANAGRYTLDIITKDGCIYTAKTDSVKIVSVTPPCTAYNNYAEFSNTFDVSLSSISGYVDGGSYFIKDYNGRLQMEFAGTNRPVAGIYTTKNYSDGWGQGNVRIRILNQGYYYSPESNNKVYVNSNNGTLVINMCDAPGTWSTFKTVVKLQVTVPQ